MQAGLYHLRRMGIQKLTHSAGLSSAMNRLPDEAIELAAASHIERELQITPWALTSNFVASTKVCDLSERLFCQVVVLLCTGTNVKIFVICHY